MLIEFQLQFTSKNKECICKLTTSQVGFHSAHTAISTPIKPPTVLPLLPCALATSVPTTTPYPWAIVTNDGLHMYYCWTHGLGFNCNHTSATCSNPAEGHHTTATVKNMHGGNNTIMSNCHHPKPEWGGKLAAAPQQPKLVEHIITTNSTSLQHCANATGPPATPFYAIANSGCTAHFFSSTTPICNKHPTTAPITIHTPSGTIMHSTHEADLDLPGLPAALAMAILSPTLQPSHSFPLVNYVTLDASLHSLPPLSPSVMTMLSSSKATTLPNQSFGYLTSAHKPITMPTLP